MKDLLCPTTLFVCVINQSAVPRDQQRGSSPILQNDPKGSFFAHLWPERLARILVYPVPLVGCLFFDAVRPFLAKATSDKVELLRGEAHGIEAPMPSGCLTLGARAVRAVEAARRLRYYRGPHRNDPLLCRQLHDVVQSPPIHSRMRTIFLPPWTMARTIMQTMEGGRENPHASSGSEPRKISKNLCRFMWVLPDPHESPAEVFPVHVSCVL